MVGNMGVRIEGGCIKLLGRSQLDIEGKVDT